MKEILLKYGNDLSILTEMNTDYLKTKDPSIKNIYNDYKYYKKYEKIVNYYI